MQLLPLRSNVTLSFTKGLPLAVYTAGSDKQISITRLEGFSAHQLLITFSGTGKYRQLGHKEWKWLEPGSLLYIPAGLPNEYMPAGDEPWHVGYATYVENTDGMLAGWGFGEQAFSAMLTDIQPLYELIERIWQHSGTEYQPWAAAEALISLCLEIVKQMHSSKPNALPVITFPNGKMQENVVDSTIRFIHDHLSRSITVAELAARAGYSQKQLTRLFKQQLGQTPLQYLQSLRLHTANLLVIDNPNLTIRQIAAATGMEPVYFNRLYRRAFGCTPSQSRM